MSVPDKKPPQKTPANIPKPKPYHITEPFQERNLWCFWLAADDDVLQFVDKLNCILQASHGSPFQRRLRGRVLFAVNPRYDHEEAWLWISDLLESETSRVELNESWESAIDSAHEKEAGDKS